MSSSSRCSQRPSRRWRRPRATTPKSSLFLPGGHFVVVNINDGERQRLESMPVTSTHAERMCAIGRHLDRLAGSQRSDTQLGILCSKHDETMAWVMARPDP